jgi:serine/threonine protein kinase/Tfp pilus assembly protein PilF
MSSLMGTRIGHFRVVDVLGKGGMGEVYVGYDETLERKVALKSIKPQHRLNEAAKARFLREARILSQLHHPNICQIHDYIEGDEADVLVLELIRGQSLGETLKKGLTFRQKLMVANQIASVLIAAHEKGIVHRDLKPDNVMLDEEGQVKVLDFGLSRSHVDESTLVLTAENEAAARQSLEDLARTHNLGLADSSGKLTTAGQVLGTLGYMSPEQARGEPATPASDMYSFGLLLQQLFTGKPPYQPGGSLPALLAKAQGGETVPVQGIDRDMAAFINRLKSLSPASRPSAVDAAERIQWIIDKPARRTKRLLTAAAVIVLTLLSAFLAVQTLRARRAEAAARRDAEVSKKVTEFMVDMFKESDPYKSGKSGGDITARQLLDRGVEKINKELGDQPEIRSRLLNTTGGVYASLAIYDRAEQLLKEGLRIREQVFPADHPDIADSLNSLGRLYGRNGRYAEAERLCKRALRIREKAFGPDHPDVADNLNNLGWLYLNQGRYAEAEPLYKRAIAIREKVLGPDHPDVAGSLNNLAMLYRKQGRYAEAEPLYKRALAIYEKAFGPDHPTVADSLNNLGWLYNRQGRYAEAEPLINRALHIREKAFGPDHPTVADSLNNLGWLYAVQGHAAAAEPPYKRSLAIFEKAFGPDHPNVAAPLNNLAAVYVDEKRYAEAEPLYRRALAIVEKAFGQDHPDVATVLTNLAEAVGDEGKFGEAAQLFDRSVSIYEKTLRPDHPDLAQALYQFGLMRAREGKRVESLDLLKRALPAGADKPFMASIRNDCRPLKGDPEFEKIAAEVEGRQRAQR